VGRRRPDRTRRGTQSDQAPGRRAHRRIHFRDYPRAGQAVVRGEGRGETLARHP
jgi:hypothetical protein